MAAKMHRAGKAIMFTEAALANARHLRGEMTEVEKMLWYHLRRQNMLDIKFRKQVPLGNYIVDFAAFTPKLVIELDGGQHAENQQYDTYRDAWLVSQGYKVLRFWNNDVTGNLQGVLAVIAATLNHLGVASSQSTSAPSLTLPLKGEGIAPDNEETI